MDPLIPGLALSVGLLLAAAKAHGRQVRLERELEGHHEVVFGGDNPAFVVGLWRRDRVRYWTVAPLAALLFGALAWWLRPGWGWALVAVLLWAPVAGFATAGLLSLAALQGRMREKSPPAGWRRDAARGSLLWWGLAAALAAGVALVARLA